MQNDYQNEVFWLKKCNAPIQNDINSFFLQQFGGKEAVPRLPPSSKSALRGLGAPFMPHPHMRRLLTLVHSNWGGGGGGGRSSNFLLLLKVQQFVHKWLQSWCSENAFWHTWLRTWGINKGFSTTGYDRENLYSGEPTIANIGCKHMKQSKTILNTLNYRFIMIKSRFYTFYYKNSA